MRVSAAGLVVACLACNPAPPASKSSRVSIAPPPTTTVAQPPRDPEAAYTLAFDRLRVGDHAGALRAFRDAVDALRTAGAAADGGGPRVEVGGLGLPPVIEGDWIVGETNGGLVFAKADTGALERYVPMTGVLRVAPFGGGAVAVMTVSGATLIDVRTGAVVGRIEGASESVRGSRFVAVAGQSPAPFVELWDAATRQRLRRLGDPSTTVVVPVRFADSGRVVIAHGSDRVFAWEAATGEEIVSYRNFDLVGGPAFSTDRRYVARGGEDVVSRDVGGTRVADILGTTSLLDRASHKVLASSHVLQHPTGFAFHDRWLAAAGRGRTCLLAVPTLRVLACTPETHPVGDVDVAAAVPSFVAGGDALAIEGADGSAAVLRLPALTSTWFGRARLATGADGTSYLYDDEDHALLSIGAKGAVTRVRALGDRELIEALPELGTPEADAIARFERGACNVGGWVFPAAACAR